MFGIFSKWKTSVDTINGEKVYAAMCPRVRVRGGVSIIQYLVRKNHTDQINFIFHNLFMNSHDNKELAKHEFDFTFQFDDEEPVMITFQSMVDENQVTIMSVIPKHVDLVRDKLMKYNKVVFYLRTVDEGEADIKYSLKNSKDAISYARNGCQNDALKK